MKSFFYGLDSVFNTVVPLPEIPAHLAYGLGKAFGILCVVSGFVFTIVAIVQAVLGC